MHTQLLNVWQVGVFVLLGWPTPAWVVLGSCDEATLVEFSAVTAAVELCKHLIVRTFSSSEHPALYNKCLEQKLCSVRQSRLVNFQFNLTNYASRNVHSVGLSIGKLLEVMAALDKHPVLGADVEAFQSGGAKICVPSACHATEKALVRTIVTQLVWRLTTELPKVASTQFELASTSENANVRRDRHALSSWRLCHGGLARTRLKLPWWLDCKRMPGWQRWLLLARSSLRSKVLDRKAVWGARQVLRRNAWLASVWAQEAQKYSIYDSFHTVPQEHLEELQGDAASADQLSLVSFAMVPGTDARWQLPMWRLWQGFCPMGYVAALVMRARAAVRNRRWRAAKRDLSMAWTMLGGSNGMMDFLDKHVWGIDSSRISKDLKYVFDASDCSPGSSCHGSAKASDRLPSPGEQEALQLQWHALQLNTLVRLRLEDVQPMPSMEHGTPKLALLAFPSFMSLFVVPMFEHIWDADLRLAILHIGPWEMQHEKCAACMERYSKSYHVDDWALQAIPYNSSEDYVTGSGSIIWETGFSLQDFFGHLHMALTKNAEATDAKLIVCAAPAWVCAGLTAFEARPIVVLDLLDPTLHAPEDIASNSDVVFAQMGEIAYELKQWANFNLTEGFLHTLWVREEPIRSYGSPEMGPNVPSRLPAVARGLFFPFVALPSMHVSSRYNCASASARVVVMREGSSSWAGKFERTLRGKLFFSTLAQVITAASPWQFKLLPYSRERLSYTELAQHRAAVWMPMVHHSKQTFNDLVMMGIPVFMPDASLQMSFSGLYFCALQMQVKAPPWVIEQCRWEEIGRRLPLAKFFRNPFVQRFESLSGLVVRLAVPDCEDLQMLSDQMSRWNEGQVADDAAFWRTAVHALLMNTDEQGTHAASADKAKSVVNASRPKFRSPHTPVGKCSHTLKTKYCEMSGRGREWIDRCCEHVQQLEHALVDAASEELSGIPEPNNCLRHPKGCSLFILQYGMHLLHGCNDFEGATMYCQNASNPV